MATFFGNFHKSSLFTTKVILCTKLILGCTRVFSNPLIFKTSQKCVLESFSTWYHRWELTINHPIFTMVMAIYHYVERIWIILVTPNFSYNIYDNENKLSGWNINTYHPGEQLVNYHHYCFGNRERVIAIYAWDLYEFFWYVLWWYNKRLDKCYTLPFLYTFIKITAPHNIGTLIIIHTLLWVGKEQEWSTYATFLIKPKKIPRKNTKAWLDQTDQEYFET